MNGYIIDPTWFYWLSVVSSLRTTLVILAVLLCIAVIIALVEHDVANIKPIFDSDIKTMKKCRNVIKYASIGMIVCLLCVTFIPSKETLIEMQVAKYATWENASWTVDQIKSAVDYIIKAIQGVST